MISQKAINDFKATWKKEFDEELSDQKAQIKAEKFLRFFKMIYKPIPKEWVEKFRDVKNEPKNV